MQIQLDAAFGKGRVEVGLDTTNNKITLKTMNPAGGEDATSTLKLVSGNADVKYALGLQEGASNRMNMSEQLKKVLGEAAFSEDVVKDENGQQKT